MRTHLLPVSLAVIIAGALPAQSVGYYRWPTIQNGTIVFTAEGDLWKVPATGGHAVRLTTHASEELRAHLSPDGRTIAFSAAYEGPTEVYTMSVDGGLPTRQTFDGGNARVVAWTPRNTILYATTRFSTLPAVQLAEVDMKTGHRTMVPLAQGSDGMYAPNGTLYFTRFDWQGSHTKRYRGGQAQSLWKWTGSAEATPVMPTYNGTSKTPMVFRNRLYFASDRTSATEKDPKPGVMNIWSSDMNGGDLRQETSHADYDVQTPAISSDGKIVYQQGADIWLLDVAAGRSSPRKVNVTLSSDLEQMRETWVTNPMAQFSGAHLSPNGDRVLLTTLGHVWVAPVGQGRIQLATPMPKGKFIRYRGARFMSDGKSLVALSDESGEVELWNVPANGIGPRTQLTKDGTIIRWDGVPSPDGKKIAHHDRDNRLYVYDVATRTNKLAATSMTQSNWIASGNGFFDLAWSPDSRWIAYGDVAPNMISRIGIYDTQTGSKSLATTDRFDSYSPTWSPDGKWLFFLSDRTFQSSVGAPWGTRAPEPYFDNQTRIYAVALQASGSKWPYVQRTELDTAVVGTGNREPGTGATPRPAAGDSASPRPAAAAARAIVIDTAGLSTRIYEVPVPAGNYNGLSMDGQRLYYQAVLPGTPRRTPLMQIEFKNLARPETFMDDVAEYELSQDRKKILVRRGQELWVLDAGARSPATPALLAERKVDLANWTFPTDPVAMRHQMFEDAWRLERDYFYDPKMNGVDWKAMREKYRPLAERVTSRAELSDVLGQMVAELSTLHIFVNGGDLRRGTENVVPASLGARLDRDEAAGGYRVAYIYRHDPDVPADRPPLEQPEANVRVGEVITAINGIPALTSDPSALLRNQAGKQVLITVKSSNGAERQVVVTPWTTARENAARYGEWEYTRRLMTDSIGGGRIGYLHLRAMGAGDMAQFNRDYYPVFNREGLIIDVRNNNGGNIDSWILGRLLRKAWSYWQPRTGSEYWNMQYAFRGPMVVLVNEKTASDGEAFAEGFRRLGLGKVIGTRTWGGEVWLSQDNILVDRGVATAAQQAVYGLPERKMIIEGWGVDPDIVVDNLPAETFAGKDRQLEAAIRELLAQIRKR